MAMVNQTISKMLQWTKENAPEETFKYSLQVIGRDDDGKIDQ